MASTPAEKKRKLNSQPKFYAVRAGHRPGVYNTWIECQEMIKGFKGCSYKSFATRTEADAFVAGRPIPTSGNEQSATPQKFYGVATGQVPGVYTNWNDAQEQIRGTKAPKYKKFTTRAEAEEFVRSGGAGYGKIGRPTKRALGADEIEDRSQEDGQEETAEQLVQSEQPAKKARVARTQIQDTVVTAAVDDPAKPIHIYTDGSSLGNGKMGAVAGVGVFFGIGDPRNVSEPLPGPLQTNQRAELTAILRGLQKCSLTRDVIIYTDSRYSIDCVTTWHKAWERNQWMTSMKKPVMNKDLIQLVLAKIREREGHGGKTQFIWIKGHEGNVGNEAADRLAVNGARMASSA